jgi:hypothetical protein
LFKRMDYEFLSSNPDEIEKNSLGAGFSFVRNKYFQFVSAVSIGCMRTVEGCVIKFCWYINTKKPP